MEYGDLYDKIHGKCSILHILFLRHLELFCQFFLSQILPLDFKNISTKFNIFLDKYLVLFLIYQNKPYNVTTYCCKMIQTLSCLSMNLYLKVIICLILNELERCKVVSSKLFH